MFTGIIQSTGTVLERRESSRGVTFRVDAGDFNVALRPGDSVSVNGACHTVERCDADAFGFTSVPETLRVTTMATLEAGARVNVELAATPDTMLGGHLVQGHIDAVGQVVSISLENPAECLLTVSLPTEVHDVLVDRGSVAIDGVSLTVARRHDTPAVTIAVVPFTLGNTIIATYREGTQVNVEADVIGKYVRRYLEQLLPPKSAEPDRS